MERKRNKGFLKWDTRAVIVLVLVIVAVTIILTPFIVVPRTPKAEAKTEEIVEPQKEYSIEYLTPTIVRVTGRKCKWENVGYGKYGIRNFPSGGFGNCFAKAIQEIEERHIIKQITPINYDFEGTSVTKQLFIIIKTKSSSEGAGP